jgi:hypothetical protein
MADKHERKDYMATISWSRLMCGAPQPMFGSEIKTDSPICIRICKAYISDYSSATDYRVSSETPAMLEVELTPVQWAEFLTSGNMGDGVPCTITRLDGKRTSPVESRNIAKEYDDFIKEKFDNFQGRIKDTEKMVKDILESGKSMNKTQMKELLHQLEFTRNNTVDGINYAKDRFREDMAKLVAKSKAEVNAYAELRLSALGAKFLMNDGSDAPAPQPVEIANDDKN